MIARVHCPYSGIQAQFVVTDPEQHIQRHWSRGHFYEGAGMLRDLWDRFGDDPPTTVWDVGACLGNHSVWFARAFGCDVVAIEPLDMYRRHLQKNLVANGVDDRIAVLPCAVGAHRHRGDVDVFGGEGMARLVPGKSVSVITLDDLTGPCPDIIKLDIEGGEMAALAGAKRTLEGRPVLLIEGDRIALEKWGEEYDYRVLASFNETPTHRLEPI